MTSQNKSLLPKRNLWGVAFVALLLIMAALLGLSLLSPSVGNVFSSIISNAPGGSGAALAPTEAPAGYFAAAQITVTPRPEATLETRERLIIRDGIITLVVNDTLAAQQSVEQLVDELAGAGAFVVSSSERGSGRETLPYISMHIRVPATRFAEVMDRLAALALEVRDRTESTQDVTAEYVDLQARVTSLETARDRLLQIMRESETTVDLLAAEQQLTQREAEIESIKGRLQFLSQSAQLSSIRIELTPSILSQPVNSGWNPAETLRRAFETLVNGIRGFADFLIYFAVAILPWLLVFGVLGFVGYRLIRRRRTHREAAREE
jgi:hypothetical protein